jgi:hypothetical protein
VGYATLLSYTDCHAEAERRAVDLLLEKRVNGIIFTTPQPAANVERAVSAGVATVMIERPLPVRGAHAVVIDHRSGLRDLTFGRPQDPRFSAGVKPSSSIIQACLIALYVQHAVTMSV